MRLLKTIHRSEGLNLRGRAITRQAVRGIIRRGNALLMIYSTVNGDYKFPGGGVEARETLEVALMREVREESGMQISTIESAFGKVIEYDRPVETDFDLFKMTSHYFICQVNNGHTPLTLDDYEAELGFTPIWIDIDTALATNRKILKNSGKTTHPWTQREAFVLAKIKKEMLL